MNETTFQGIVFIACPICGAQSLGAPPHGQGQACPQKLHLDKAYIDKLVAEKEAAEATRDAQIRSGMASIDITQLQVEAMQILKKMTGIDQGDDDDNSD